MSTRIHRTIRPALIALGTAAVLGLSGLALAQTPPVAPGPPAFSAMDQDRNGTVSATEFAQFRAQRMAARAAQGRPMRNAANAPTFESLDTNGDGMLTPAEVTAHQQARFAGRGSAGYGPGYGPGAGMAGRPSWRNQ
jgi:hypothetical protein